MTGLSIANLPLYWRMKRPEDPAAAGIPGAYPFGFAYDDAIGLIKQDCPPDLWTILGRIYAADANVGYLQIGLELADGYGGDLLRFLRDLFATAGKPRSVLELGCGGCYVLDALRRDGIDAQGIDPSPVAVRVAREHGLDVHQGLFPEVTGRVPVDFIFHSDVLEHIPDPVAFLKAQRKVLTPEGRVCVSVPDCSEPIANGDISMIIHQHVNYFDEGSLARTFAAAGFAMERMEKSRYGGSLYAVARPVAGRPDVPSAPADYYRGFTDKAGAAIDAIGAYLRKIIAAPNLSLGCYVPLRAIPYLAASDIADGFRLFDDAPNMHGMTIDGVSTPFENFADLQARPVTDIVVFSFSFGRKIRDKVEAAFGDKIRCVTLNDVLAGTA